MNYDDRVKRGKWKEKTKEGVKGSRYQHNFGWKERMEKGRRGKHRRERGRERREREEEEVLLSSHPFPDSNTNYLNLLEEEEKAQLNSLFPSLTNLASLSPSLSPFFCLLTISFSSLKFPGIVFPVLLRFIDSSANQIRKNKRKEWGEERERWRKKEREMKKEG